jgi:hypothetical protein
LISIDRKDTMCLLWSVRTFSEGLAELDKRISDPETVVGHIDSQQDSERSSSSLFTGPALPCHPYKTSLETIFIFLDAVKETTLNCAFAAADRDRGGAPGQLHGAHLRAASPPVLHQGRLRPLAAVGGRAPGLVPPPHPPREVPPRHGAAGPAAAAHLRPEEARVREAVRGAVQPLQPHPNAGGVPTEWYFNSSSGDLFFFCFVGCGPLSPP